MRKVRGCPSIIKLHQSTGREAFGKSLGHNRICPLNETEIVLLSDRQNHENFSRTYGLHNLSQFHLRLSVMPARKTTSLDLLKKARIVSCHSLLVAYSLDEPNSGSFSPGRPSAMYGPIFLKTYPRASCS